MKIQTKIEKLNPIKRKQLFYQKFSKKELKKIADMGKKTRPRLLQARLGVLHFSKNGKECLGFTYRKGRQKNRIVWKQDLKDFLIEFMGIGRTQVLYWLRENGKIKYNSKGKW